MKRLAGFILIVALGYAGVVSAKHFWHGKTMDAKQTCDKWGNHPFNKEKFKTGSEEIRAKMACWIISNQKEFKGKDRDDIRNELGDHDGFYFSDMFPAYMITPDQSNEPNAWQIVFLLDGTERVSEVIVHENCCDEK